MMTAASPTTSVPSAVVDGHLHAGVLELDLPGDGGQHLHGHRLVGLVLQPGDVGQGAVAADVAGEGGRPPPGRALDGAATSSSSDSGDGRQGDPPGARPPPETGGISATSSPSASSVGGGHHLPVHGHLHAPFERRERRLALARPRPAGRATVAASRSSTGLAVAAEALAQDREVQHLDDHRRVVPGRSGRQDSRADGGKCRFT